MLSDHTI